MVLVWDDAGAGAPSVVLGAAGALGAAEVLGALVEMAVYIEFLTLQFLMSVFLYKSSCPLLKYSS